METPKGYYSWQIDYLLLRFPDGKTEKQVFELRLKSLDDEAQACVFQALYSKGYITEVEDSSDDMEEDSDKKKPSQYKRTPLGMSRRFSFEFFRANNKGLIAGVIIALIGSFLSWLLNKL